MDRKPLIVLFGPTASGKTALAVEICKVFNGEVVTADSMQVYKGMDIGTAKPDSDEMQGIAHHMIDLISPDENYSLAQYVEGAAKCIDDVLSRGKIPVLAGEQDFILTLWLITFLCQTKKETKLTEKSLQSFPKNAETKC